MKGADPQRTAAAKAAGEGEASAQLVTARLPPRLGEPLAAILQLRPLYSPISIAQRPRACRLPPTSCVRLPAWPIWGEALRSWASSRR